MQSIIDRQLHEAAVARNNAAQLAEEPFVVYGAHIFFNRRKELWCAILGHDLSDPVHVFGDSPAKAVEAFNAAWYKELTEEEIKLKERVE